MSIFWYFRCKTYKKKQKGVVFFKYPSVYYSVKKLPFLDQKVWKIGVSVKSGIERADFYFKKSFEKWRDVCIDQQGGGERAHMGEGGERGGLPLS